MVYAVIRLVKISCNYAIQYTIQSTISVKINISDINTDPSPKTIVLWMGQMRWTAYEVESMKSEV